LHLQKINSYEDTAELKLANAASHSWNTN